MKNLFFYCLLLIVSQVHAQKEKAFDFYSAGVRAAYSYDFGVAIFNYTEAIKLKPDYMIAYYNRGAMFIKTREFDNTISDMYKVLSLDSTYYDAYIYLGDAYIGKSDIAKAKEMYDLVLKKIPNHKKALNGQALCFFYLSRYEECIAAYNKYLALVKDDADAYYKRGLAKFSLDNFTGSISDFSSAIDIRKDFLQALEARAKSYRFDSDLEKACLDWNACLALGSTTAAGNIKTFCTK